jgi:hypothetical protein
MIKFVINSKRYILTLAILYSTSRHFGSHNFREKKV